MLTAKTAVADPCNQHTFLDSSLRIALCMGILAMPKTAWACLTLPLAPFARICRPPSSSAPGRTLAMSVSVAPARSAVFA